jgi:hypothetical protein
VSPALALSLPIATPRGANAIAAAKQIDGGRNPAVAAESLSDRGDVVRAQAERLQGGELGQPSLAARNASMAQCVARLWVRSYSSPY